MTALGESATADFPKGARRFDRLLIVRLSAMGDIIHTLPAAAALRQAYPHAKLGWLIEERWAELLRAPGSSSSDPRSRQRPLADYVHTVNTTKWRHAPFSLNTWQQITAVLKELRGIHYDAAIDFQGAIRSAVLARWSRAPIAYGDARPREKGAGIFYTRRIPLHKNDTHVVQQAVELAEAVISAPAISRSAMNWPVPFPIDPDAENKILNLTDNLNGFAILNPGAGWGAKRWPSDRYGEVARQLAKDGMNSLVNYGPGEDDLAHEVEAASAGAAKRISCSISDLIALTRRARIFIGGDTGPMHMAAALKVPVVGIFGPTNPVRNGPFDTRSIVLRSANSVTDHTRHLEPEQGLLEISASEVIAAARKLLQDESV